MTFSKLGTDGQLIEEIDQQTGKKKFVFTPTIDVTGKELPPIPLYKKSRLQGTYIIGATGTGKSGLIENLIMQDISQQIGVCVLDPHGDLINKVIARLDEKDIEKVILLDTVNTKYEGTDYYPGLNIYQCDDPIDDDLVTETFERIKHIFNLVALEASEDKLKLGVRVSQGIRNSAFTFIDSFPVYGCTMLELPMLFEEDIPRDKMIALVPDTDTTVQTYWKRFKEFDKSEKASRSDMVVNKIEGYIINRKLRRIIGQSRTTIHFRDVMDKGKILLVKLPGENEEMTELLGSLVIAQLLGAAFSRKNVQLDKRRQFNIYADEFEQYATDDFTRLLKECRKYGMAVTIAHQSRDFLDLRNQAASLQVANLCVLRISNKDAKEVVGNFYLDPEPGDTREKPVRTPVMEPIQYMVSHGIHPLEHTRTFIEVYGKELVELAKKEDEDERAWLAEKRKYEHDLEAGVRYYAPPLIQVTYHYRNLLTWLNKLFFEAMKAGKTSENLEQNLDDMLSSRLRILVDTFIQAFQQNKKGYREALAAYQAFVFEQSGVVEAGVKNGILDRLITMVGSNSPLPIWHELDRNRLTQWLKDGIIDVLAEDFQATNKVWWETVTQRGVEQSLFAENQVVQLPAPSGEADTDTALTKVSGVANRKEALQLMLTKLSVALAKKTASLRRKEAMAQKRLRDAARDYLLAEVRAVRANMLFVEKNWQFVAGSKEGDGTARIYFEELFSHEELFSRQAGVQSYNKDALIIFQYEDGTDHSVKPTTYDEIRQYWHVHTGLCHFFNTWKEAVSFYFHLFNAYWFHINPTTFFDKGNWQKTEREVYWKRSYIGYQWERNLKPYSGGKKALTWSMYRTKKEDKKRLWLDTWELKPGIETTWFTPAMLEAEIERRLKQLEASWTYTASDPFYGERGFLQRLISIETQVFNPAKDRFDCFVIENVEDLGYHWKEAKERTKLVPENAIIQAQEQLIEQEVALLERIEAEKMVYDVFVAAFQEQMRQIMGELAIAPVQQESGLWTEEPIGHASYADTAGKLANELSNLPNFIARVKILAADDETFVEHTIRTLKPEQGLGEEKLKERMKRIKQHMIDNGYCRAKNEVDAEIRKRHEVLRQQDKQHASLISQQSRVTRQVRLPEN